MNQGIRTSYPRSKLLSNYDTANQRNSFRSSQQPRFNMSMEPKDSNIDSLINKAFKEKKYQGMLDSGAPRNMNIFVDSDSEHNNTGEKGFTERIPLKRATDLLIEKSVSQFPDTYSSRNNGLVKSYLRNGNNLGNPAKPYNVYTYASPAPELDVSDRKNEVGYNTFYIPENKMAIGDDTVGPKQPNPPSDEPIMQNPPYTKPRLTSSMRRTKPNETRLVDEPEVDYYNNSQFISQPIRKPKAPGYMGNLASRSPEPYLKAQTGYNEPLNKSINYVENTNEPRYEYNRQTTPAVYTRPDYQVILGRLSEFRGPEPYMNRTMNESKTEEPKYIFIRKPVSHDHGGKVDLSFNYMKNKTPEKKSTKSDEEKIGRLQRFIKAYLQVRDKNATKIQAVWKGGTTRKIMKLYNDLDEFIYHLSKVKFNHFSDNFFYFLDQLFNIYKAKIEEENEESEKEPEDKKEDAYEKLKRDYDELLKNYNDLKQSTKNNPNETTIASFKPHKPTDNTLSNSNDYDGEDILDEISDGDEESQKGKRYSYGSVHSEENSKYFDNEQPSDKNRTNRLKLMHPKNNSAKKMSRDSSTASLIPKHEEEFNIKAKNNLKNFVKNLKIVKLDKLAVKEKSKPKWDNTNKICDNERSFSISPMKENLNLKSSKPKDQQKIIKITKVTTKITKKHNPIESQSSELTLTSVPPKRSKSQENKSEKNDEVKELPKIVRIKEPKPENQIQFMNGLQVLQNEHRNFEKLNIDNNELFVGEPEKLRKKNQRKKIKPVSNQENLAIFPEPRTEIFRENKTLPSIEIEDFSIERLNPAEKIIIKPESFLITGNKNVPEFNDLEPNNMELFTLEADRPFLRDVDINQGELIEIPRCYNPVEIPTEFDENKTVVDKIPDFDLKGKIKKTFEDIESNELFIKSIKKPKNKIEKKLNEVRILGTKKPKRFQTKTVTEITTTTEKTTTVENDDDTFIDISKNDEFTIEKKEKKDLEIQENVNDVFIKKHEKPTKEISTDMGENGLIDMKVTKPEKINIIKRKKPLIFSKKVANVEIKSNKKAPKLEKQAIEKLCIKKTDKKRNDQGTEITSELNPLEEITGEDVEIITKKKIILEIENKASEFEVVPKKKELMPTDTECLEIKAKEKKKPKIEKKEEFSLISDIPKEINYIEKKTIKKKNFHLHKTKFTDNEITKEKEIHIVVKKPKTLEEKKVERICLLGTPKPKEFDGIDVADNEIDFMIKKKNIPKKETETEITNDLIELTPTQSENINIPPNKKIIIPELEEERTCYEIIGEKKIPTLSKTKTEQIEIKKLEKKKNVMISKTSDFSIIHEKKEEEKKTDNEIVYESGIEIPATHKKIEVQKMEQLNIPPSSPKKEKPTEKKHLKHFDVLDPETDVNLFSIEGTKPSTVFPENKLVKNEEQKIFIKRKKKKLAEGETEITDELKNEKIYQNDGITIISNIDKIDTTTPKEKKETKEKKELPELVLDKNVSGFDLINNIKKFKQDEIKESPNEEYQIIKNILKAKPKKEKDYKLFVDKQEQFKIDGKKETKDTKEMGTEPEPISDNNNNNNINKPKLTEESLESISLCPEKKEPEKQTIKKMKFNLINNFNKLENKFVDQIQILGKEKKPNISKSKQESFKIDPTDIKKYRMLRLAKKNIKVRNIKHDFVFEKLAVDPENHFELKGSKANKKDGETSTSRPSIKEPKLQEDQTVYRFTLKGKKPNKKDIEIQTKPNSELDKTFLELTLLGKSLNETNSDSLINTNKTNNKKGTATANSNIIPCMEINSFKIFGQPNYISYQSKSVKVPNLHSNKKVNKNEISNEESFNIIDSKPKREFKDLEYNVDTTDKINILIKTDKPEEEKKEETKEKKEKKETIRHKKNKTFKNLKIEIGAFNLFIDNNNVNKKKYTEAETEIDDELCPQMIESFVNDVQYKNSKVPRPDVEMVSEESQTPKLRPPKVQNVVVHEIKKIKRNSAHSAASIEKDMAKHKRLSIESISFELSNKEKEKKEAVEKEDEEENDEGNDEENDAENDDAE